MQYIPLNHHVTLCTKVKTKGSFKLRIDELQAAKRKGNMDMLEKGEKKGNKNLGSATSLKFIGIERVRTNLRGGNLINQLLRREAF